ncbi:MAG: cupin domain-containing protein [Candidatus Microbacterium stercoravium]
MSGYNVTQIGTVDAWTGKEFVEGELGAANVGISVNATEPGGESPFWHSHARIEEVYLVLEGTGEIAIGDDIVPLQAGTLVRVSPGSMLALRCLPDSPAPMKWICVRAGADSLADIGNDATLDSDRPFPWNA